MSVREQRASNNIVPQHAIPHHDKQRVTAAQKTDLVAKRARDYTLLHGR
jgi:hypothetical protein